MPAPEPPPGTDTGQRPHTQREALPDLQDHQAPGVARTGSVTPLSTSADGDLSALVALADPDIVCAPMAGGGYLRAEIPVHGPERVVSLLFGLARRYAGTRLRPVRLASGDGFLLDNGGTVLGVPGVELAGGRIAELNLVVDPAKLARTTLDVAE